jgi:hypothetical protein
MQVLLENSLASTNMRVVRNDSHSLLVWQGLHPSIGLSYILENLIVIKR